MYRNRALVRDHTIKIRLNDLELEQAKREAEQAGMELATYLRHIATASLKQQHAQSHFQAA